MPYTIGVKMHTNRSKDIIDGVYAFSTYGFPIVMSQKIVNEYNNCSSKEIKEKNYSIYYCKTPNDAEELCKSLRKSYRSEFKNNAKRQGDENMSDFKVYPIKLNSPKFPFRCDLSSLKEIKKSGKRYLCKILPKKKAS